MRNNKNKNKLSGFSMIEAMIAVFICGVILPVFFIILSNLLGFSYSNREHIKASNLAQEGVEYVRNLRDQNWKNNLTAFNSPVFPSFASGSEHCLYTDENFNFWWDNCFLMYGKFTRKIKITVSGDTRVISCTVTWPLRGGGNGTVTIDDTLSSWGNAD